MARLYDELMQTLPGSSVWRTWLDDCTVFEVQNIADFVFDEIWHEDKTFTALDMPALIPPHTHTFFEYAPPPYFNKDRDLPPHTRIGVRLYAEDHNPATPIQDAAGTSYIGVRWILRGAVYMPQGFGQGYWKITEQFAARADTDGSALDELRTIRRTGILSGFVAYLSRDGRYMAEYWPNQTATLMGWFMSHIMLPESIAQDMIKADVADGTHRYRDICNIWEKTLHQLTDWYGRQGGYLCIPVFMAIGLMHCKNVTVTEQRPPDWQQKAAQKKHGRPLVTYHVLNIEPMKTVLRTEGDIEHNGLKKALHICRGHFKTFTSDKPLFGKVTGTYWWQPHVRGSIDEGVALKDYNVKAPKASESE